MPIERQPEATPTTTVINLMDAVRRSIDAEKPAQGAPGKAADRKKPAKGAQESRFDTCLYGRTPYLAVLQAGSSIRCPDIGAQKS